MANINFSFKFEILSGRAAPGSLLNPVLSQVKIAVRDFCINFNKQSLNNFKIDTLLRVRYSRYKSGTEEMRILLPPYRYFFYQGLVFTNMISEAENISIFYEKLPNRLQYPISCLFNIFYISRFSIEYTFVGECIFLKSFLSFVNSFSTKRFVFDITR